MKLHSHAGRLALILVSLIAAGSARAMTPQVRSQLDQFAQRIINGTRGKRVTVDLFSPKGLADTNYGTALQQGLIDALEKKQPDVVAGAASIRVEGEYRLITDAVTQLEVIKVSLDLVDAKTGESLDAAALKLKKSDLETTLDGTSTIADVLQLSGAIDPQGEKKVRNKQLKQLHQKPVAHIHQKTLISASQATPYDLQIRKLPRDKYKAHPETPFVPESIFRLNGSPYVNLERGEVYEVKIFNRDSQPVAVRLSIDGLDVFHFSEERNEHGEPAFTHFIVPPHGETVIPGWFRKLAKPDNYLSFLVTAHGEGAISEAGIKARGSVGVIHAQFSHAAPLVAGHKARSGNETGFGPPRSVAQEAVRFEVEPPHAFVSLRYVRQP